MIFQGDNTAAFGGNFLTINISSESGIVPAFSRAEIKIGCICKNIKNPVFPLTINLNEEETVKLQTLNTVFMAVWDSLGRKKTCIGSVSFKTQTRRV